VVRKGPLRHHSHPQTHSSQAGGGNTSGSSIAVASAAAIAVASTTADATEAVVPAVDENHLSPGYLALADLLGLSTLPAFRLFLIIIVILFILIPSFSHGKASAVCALSRRCAAASKARPKWSGRREPTWRSCALSPTAPSPCSSP
jgi:hypothetical protein